jgi:hypothetical protein
MATLELAAAISPPRGRSDYPEPARWPLTPGAHVIEARVPFTRVAARVRVDVR